MRQLPVMRRFPAARVRVACLAALCVGAATQGSAQEAATCRIAPGSIAGLHPGDTLGEARAAWPHVKLVRAKILDGVDVVQARVDGQVLWEAEVGVELPAGRLPDATSLVVLKTFSPSCRDEHSVGPGTLLSTAARAYGGLAYIARSDIEQREFAVFRNHPPGLMFRIDISGVFEGNARRTREYRSDARVLAVLADGGGGKP